MEVEECKGLANAWPRGKTLRRRRRPLLPAPVPKARYDVFFAANHTYLCPLLLQRIPQHSSPTSQRERLPPRLPPQSPSISQARHHTSTCLEGDNQTPNHCYHTPGYHALAASLQCGSNCLLYTSPSPRDRQKSRMPSSA